VALLLFLAFGPDDSFVAIIGTINAAVVIALVVDSFNRWNDPRHAKRPPDTP
jgi:hypothetical protein